MILGGNPWQFCGKMQSQGLYFLYPFLRKEGLTYMYREHTIHDSQTDNQTIVCLFDVQKNHINYIKKALALLISSEDRRLFVPFWEFEKNQGTRIEKSLLERGRRRLMVIAVCTKNEAEYRAIADAVMSYPEREQYVMVPQWFPSVAEYRNIQLKYPFAITIFAFDDIENQELSILVHRTSEGSQIVWIGEDERFGVASYRVRAANFVMKPAAEKAIWVSLDRCIRRLKEEHAIGSFDYVNMDIGG